LKEFEVHKDFNTTETKSFIGRVVSVDLVEEYVVVMYTDGDKERLTFAEAKQFVLNEHDTDMVLFARAEWDEAIEKGEISNDYLGDHFADEKGKLTTDGKVKPHGGKNDVKITDLPRKDKPKKNVPTKLQVPSKSSPPTNPYQQSTKLSMSDHIYNQGSLPDKIDLDKFKKNTKRSKAGPVKYYVSHPFTGPEGDVYYMVVIKFPFSLWYISSDMLLDILTDLYGDEAPAFMSTFRDCPERRHSFGKNEVSRNKPKDGGKGYPKSCITITYAFSKAEHHQFKDVAFDGAFQKIRYALSTVQNVADAILCWLEENQNGVIAHWNNKGLKSEEIIQNINNELNDCFKSKHDAYYNQPLDRYLLDWEIKSFFTDVVGINDWPSYSQADMQRIFSRYPTKTAPAFESIRQPNLMNEL
jgi:hypothetical protein